VPEFQSIVLGQLGESRLVAALDVDVSGAHSHARALDADTKGPLRDIHRRVGTSIFFESSGGQKDNIARLPELRFALGNAEVDTTSVDNAALALEARAFFIRRVGADGFRINWKPTLKKVVSDRRASLDPEREVRPAMERLVKEVFDSGRSIPIIPFPASGADVQDSPRLTLVLMEPEVEWGANGSLREQISEWTKQRGNSSRLYPGSLVWCLKKRGRELREKTETWLAWQRVRREIDEGTLGGDFDRADRVDIQARLKEAEDDARDEVWASYRYLVLSDNQELGGLKEIDLGAGHASQSETLCGRIIGSLKSAGLLNESVGAGFLERNWPNALKESGAWPLSGLRQSFLNGSFTRLLDPDVILRGKIVEFVGKGDLGLASGQKSDGTYERVWFEELVAPEDVAFEPGVFLLRKERAKALKQGVIVSPEPLPGLPAEPKPEPEPGPESVPPAGPQTRTIRLVGSVPPEVWNRLGTKLVPKLRSGGDLEIEVRFLVTADAKIAENLLVSLRQILSDMGLGDRLRIESS